MDDTKENSIEEEKEGSYWNSTVLHIEQYVATKLKLYKFELVERVSLIGSSVISSLFVYVTLFLCFIFALFAGAYGIGEYTGHIYLGFIYIVAFLLLMGIIFYSARNWLRKKFLDLLMQKMFKNNEK